MSYKCPSEGLQLNTMADGWRYRLYWIGRYSATWSITSSKLEVTFNYGIWVAMISNKTSFDSLWRAQQSSFHRFGSKLNNCDIFRVVFAVIDLNGGKRHCKHVVLLYFHLSKRNISGVPKLTGNSRIPHCSASLGPGHYFLRSLLWMKFGDDVLFWVFVCVHHAVRHC